MELVPRAAVEAVAEVEVPAQGIRPDPVQALVIRDPVAAVVHDPVVALDRPVVPRRPAPADQLDRAVNRNKFSLIRF